jgi:hypothetical protein
MGTGVRKPKAKSKNASRLSLKEKDSIKTTRKHGARFSATPIAPAVQAKNSSIVTGI